MHRRRLARIRIKIMMVTSRRKGLWGEGAFDFSELFIWLLPNLPLKRSSVMTSEQHHNCTKNHWIIHIKQVNFIVCKLYLNKAIKIIKIWGWWYGWWKKVSRSRKTRNDQENVTNRRKTWRLNEMWYPKLDPWTEKRTLLEKLGKYD